jgi:hypothetical protein
MKSTKKHENVFKAKRFHAVRAQMSKLRREEKSLRKHFAMILGDDEAIQVGEYVVSINKHVRSSVDIETIAKDHGLDFLKCYEDETEVVSIVITRTKK